MLAADVSFLVLVLVMVLFLVLVLGHQMCWLVRQKVPGGGGVHTHNWLQQKKLAALPGNEADKKDNKQIQKPKIFKVEIAAAAFQVGFGPPVCCAWRTLSTQHELCNITQCFVY